MTNTEIDTSSDDRLLTAMRAAGRRADAADYDSLVAALTALTAAGTPDFLGRRPVCRLERMDPRRAAQLALAFAAGYAQQRAREE
jgi:hypothetical protein